MPARPKAKRKTHNNKPATKTSYILSMPDHLSDVFEQYAADRSLAIDCYSTGLGSVEYTVDTTASMQDELAAFAAWVTDAIMKLPTIEEHEV